MTKYQVSLFSSKNKSAPKRGYLARILENEVTGVKYREFGSRQKTKRKTEQLWLDDVPKGALVEYRKVYWNLNDWSIQAGRFRVGEDPTPEFLNLVEESKK